MYQDVLKRACMGSSKWQWGLWRKYSAFMWAFCGALNNHRCWTGPLLCRLQVLYVFHLFVLSACLWASDFQTQLKHHVYLRLVKHWAHLNALHMLWQTEMILCNMCYQRMISEANRRNDSLAVHRQLGVGCSCFAGPLWWLISWGIFCLSRGGLWARVTVTGSLLHGSLWDALLVLWHPLLTAWMSLKLLWGLRLPWVKETKTRQKHEAWHLKGVRRHQSHK